MAQSGEQEEREKCAYNKLYARPIFVVYMSIKLLPTKSRPAMKNLCSIESA